jgi:hypothetical protein
LSTINQPIHNRNDLQPQTQQLLAIINFAKQNKVVQEDFRQQRRRADPRLAHT